MRDAAPPGLVQVWGCAVLLTLAAVGCGPHKTARGSVYAAASIAAAVQEVAGDAFTVSAAGSSTLAQQIAAGADAALFVSAHRRWMDQLDVGGLLAPGTRRSLVANELVWIAAADLVLELDLSPGADVASQFTGRLAVGDPEHVPAGEYARMALQSLGLWESLSDRLAPANDVRAATTMVETGAASVGIVYRTDALTSDVRILAPMPAAAAPPVVYEVAVVRRGDSVAARQLLALRTGPVGQQVFAVHGFTPATEPPAAVDQEPEPPASSGLFTTAEMSALRLSLLVGLVATLLALVPGAALAWWLARGSGPARTVVSGLVSMPLVLPPVVVGYFLLLLFGPRGPLGGVTEALLGHALPFTWVAAAVAATVMGFPLMVMALRQAFESVDENLEQAAATLGAPPLRVFWTVTLPLSRGGLVAGSSLCFARSLGEFGATVTLAGNIMGETRTLPLAIWTALQSPGGEAVAWRLTWICVGLSLGAALLSAVLLRKRRGGTA